MTDEYRIDCYDCHHGENVRKRRKPRECPSCGSRSINAQKTHPEPNRYETQQEEFRNTRGF